MNNNIVMRMLNSFGQNYQGDTQQKHMRWVSHKDITAEGFSEYIFWLQVFTTLGLLARVYPAEGRANLTNLFDQVIDIAITQINCFLKEALQNPSHKSIKN